MLCLQIRRGLELHAGDEEWAREKAAQVVQFSATELAPHFKVEEEVLFPAMSRLDDIGELLKELVSQHRTLERLVEQLGSSGATRKAGALGEFAHLLEAHIRKEERELFPLYEEHAGPELQAAVERGVKNAIGEALQPRNLAFLS
jgi:iron-sulfur cluster repair protein YtfE (RIC family)